MGILKSTNILNEQRWLQPLSVRIHRYLMLFGLAFALLSVCLLAKALIFDLSVNAGGISVQKMAVGDSMPWLGSIELIPVAHAEGVEGDDEEKQDADSKNERDDDDSHVEKENSRTSVESGGTGENNDNVGVAGNEHVEIGNTGSQGGGNIPPVFDTAPPVITAPAPITIEATAITTPVLAGVAIAVDNVSGVLAPLNNAPAGGFPLGATTVTYSATDAAGNIGTESPRFHRRHFCLSHHAAF